MTTFAYKDGILAVDSRAVLGNWKDPVPHKKFQVLSDSVAVGCGSLAEAMTYIAWLASEQKGERPDLEETHVVQFFADGSIIVHEESGAFEYDGNIGAWGSGMPAAITALQCGKSPAEAVALAAEVDIYTGPPIYEINVAEILAEQAAEKAE